MSNKVPRAPNRTNAFWIEHIKLWRICGLSKADYCRQHDLNVGSFYNWCSTESITCLSVEPAKPSVPLKLIPMSLQNTGFNAATVSLQNATGTFAFPANMPADHIERWLSAIERLHA